MGYVQALWQCASEAVCHITSTDYVPYVLYITDFSSSQISLIFEHFFSRQLVDFESENGLAKLFTKQLTFMCARNLKIVIQKS